VTVYRWLRDGFIKGERPAPGAPWRIRLNAELRAKVAEDAPSGWLSLDDAARALGVVRQTVLHKVHRASWPPCTSVTASAKAYESRSNPNTLDCLTHRDERRRNVHVTRSAHPAPIVQPSGRAPNRQWANRPGSRLETAARSLRALAG
jgi:hypothetical protein